MTLIRTIALIGLTICFVFGVVRARADDPAGELIAILSDIQSLQGRFEQRQYDDTGALVQESSGRFRLLRPGYFAWEIETPDRQLVIADPQFVWHHDLDLETVTRRPVTGSVDTSPLQVLGGNESVLREQFTVTRPDSGRFRLVAKQGEAGFRELTLRVDGSNMLGMEILNKLNQRVTIDFLDVDRSTVLTAADFHFEPPPGADLFYYEQ
jgi:outer membrane lipoprotein carrier protein